ncbi:MAG: alanine racemase [Hyphomicrobiaceae bacterium]|nr:alanine racemase [Hyphomicrobiaceae bacterium]
MSVVPVSDMDQAKRPNAGLIGQRGSREKLSTPCLVLDLDAMERNISTMGAMCRNAEWSLRPHAKTHKSIEVARRQLAEGAKGVAVATIGEAECFQRAGLGDILITSPIPPGLKMDRLIRLAALSGSITCVADSRECIRLLQAAAGEAETTLPVLIDVDMGRHRSGVTSPDQAVALAKEIGASANLELRGLQAYAGHLSHMTDFAARSADAAVAARRIADVVSALEDEEVHLECVSGGSTGTVFIEPGLNQLTEMQCGSYVFMDLEYDVVDLDGRQSRPFEPALFVRTTVISKNVADIATVDAGRKHFATKLGTAPQIWPNEGFYQMKPESDEHGRISVVAGEDRLQVGMSFECFIPHCDPTANLFNEYHVCRKDTLVDIWPIDARGAI